MQIVRSISIKVAAALLLLSGAVMHAAVAQDYTLVEPNKLIIATGSNYPPMEFTENGKLVGYDIDLGNELARRMGLQAEYVVVEYKGIIGTLKSKRTDILMSGMTITAARKEQVLFSDGYLDAPIGAAVLKKDANTTSDKVDEKFTVGVELGSLGAIWAKENLKTSAPRTYDNLQLAINDLNAGRINMVVNNIPALRWQLRDKPNFTVTPPWEERITAIAARLEDKALIAKLNGLLADMRKDGFKEQLDAKWFGAK